MNLTKLTFVLFFLAVANASVLNLEEIKRIIADAERELSAENDNVETSEKMEESRSPLFTRKIERYGYENELNPAVEAAQGVEEAAEGVLAQLEGLATNFQVYGEKAMEVFGVALKDYVKAIRVFVVATPAKAVKTFAVGVLKTTKNLLVSIGALYKDYNPLHPLKSADHLGRLKRELTTLSTLGKAVGTLLDSTDAFVTWYADMVQKQMEIDEAQMDEMIRGFETMDPEMVKSIVLNMLRF